MIKSILAVSEGGPDAAMAFSLAALAARRLGATVDALYLPANSAVVGAGMAMSGGAVPTMVDWGAARLDDRAEQSSRAFEEILAPIPGANYATAEAADPDAVVFMGRCADLVVIGRPGTDPENLAPAAVDPALYECARPVLIAPPALGSNALESAIVAWNGSLQAARAMNYALPFLQQARSVTVLVVGSTPEEVGARDLIRHLYRHGIAARTDAIDPGAVSGRARGRALLEYAHKSETGLLVMGAYGRNQTLSFLGLGSATSKVISACRAPLLLAH